MIQVFKFFVNGVIAFASNLVVFSISQAWGFSEMICGSLGFILGTLASYTGSRLWVYRTQCTVSVKSTIYKFFGFYGLVAFIVGQSIAYISMYLGIVFAFVLANGLAAILSFYCNKNIIFRDVKTSC